MGVSPWTMDPPLAQSPKGTTGAMIHIAPFGASDADGCPVTMGSRPWLPHTVPLGLNTFRRGVIASRHGIIASRHGIIASRRGIIASRHGIIAFRHGAIAFRSNAATLHLAATRRQDVAMGVSPWTAAPPIAQSPEGTA